MEIPVRQCGECSSCCWVLAIPKLAKPPGVRCHNLCDEGCGIYEQRPESPCRTFHCAWLQGFLGPDDRPDQVGAIVWQTLRDSKLVTIVSQIPGMEIADHLMEFLKTLPMTVRLERIDREPVYIKE